MNEITCSTCYLSCIDRYTITYNQETGELVQCDDCANEIVFNEFIEHDFVCAKLMINYILGLYEPNHVKIKKNIRITRRDYNTEKDQSVRLWLGLFSVKLELATCYFQNKVWFDGGLHKFIKKQKIKRLSGHYKDWDSIQTRSDGSLEISYNGIEISIRTYSMAGRFLITFEVITKNNESHPDVGTSITFITDESSNLHRMGWQSIHGKTNDILKLANIVTYNWIYSIDSQPDWMQLLQPDENVRMI